eukprot:gene13478-3938_t
MKEKHRCSIVPSTLARRDVLMGIRATISNEGVDDGGSTFKATYNVFMETLKKVSRNELGDPETLRRNKGHQNSVRQVLVDFCIENRRLGLRTILPLTLRSQTRKEMMIAAPKVTLNLRRKFAKESEHMCTRTYPKSVEVARENFTAKLFRLAYVLACAPCTFTDEETYIVVCHHAPRAIDAD